MRLVVNAGTPPNPGRIINRSQEIMALRHFQMTFIDLDPLILSDMIASGYRCRRRIEKDLADFSALFLKAIEQALAVMTTIKSDTNVSYVQGRCIQHAIPARFRPMNISR